MFTPYYCIKMSGESFLAVSTGCLHTFPENSRTKFTNVFAKPAKVDKPWKYSLFIDIEQINFEFTPLYYENTVPDFIFGEIYGETSYKIHKCYSIECLIRSLRHPAFSGFLNSQDENGAKITIIPLYDIKIHSRFSKFLNIDSQLVPIENTEYRELKAKVYYTSSSPVLMNNINLNYVDLICNEIEPYFCDSEYKKIVARINVMGEKNQTIHMDTLIRRYYKIQNPSIEVLTFELRQPNGCRLLMEEGPPTIIKARLKEMNSNTDFFYLQVNSKSSISFPANTPSSFTVELPNEIELKGEWEVALTHAELPATERIFRNSLSHFPVKEKNAGFFVITIDKKSKNVLNSMHMSFLPGANLTLETFMKAFSNHVSRELFVRVDENEVFKILSRDLNREHYILFSPSDFEKFIFPSLENSGLTRVEEIELVLFNNESINKKLGEIYHLLESWGAGRVYSFLKVDNFGNNHQRLKSNYYFSIEEYYQNETAKKIKEEKNYHENRESTQNSNQKSIEEEKTLIKIYEKNTGIKHPPKQIPTWMFLYTDFVKPSLIADCYSNVMKLIPYKQGNDMGYGRFYTFTPLDFFRVNKDNLKTITFELRTHAGEKHDFRNINQHTSVTLYFRKITE